eukprot:g705.t1
MEPSAISLLERTREDVKTKKAEVADAATRLDMSTEALEDKLARLRRLSLDEAVAQSRRAELSLAVCKEEVTAAQLAKKARVLQVRLSVVSDLLREESVQGRAEKRCLDRKRKQLEDKQELIETEMKAAVVDLSSRLAALQTTEQERKSRLRALRRDLQAAKENTSHASAKLCLMDPTEMSREVEAVRQKGRELQELCQENRAEAGKVQSRVGVLKRECKALSTLLRSSSPLSSSSSSSSSSAGAHSKHRVHRQFGSVGTSVGPFIRASSM